MRRQNTDREVVALKRLQRIANEEKVRLEKRPQIKDYQVWIMMNPALQKKHFAIWQEYYDKVRTRVQNSNHFKEWQKAVSTGQAHRSLLIARSFKKFLAEHPEWKVSQPERPDGTEMTYCGYIDDYIAVMAEIKEIEAKLKDIGALDLVE